jgi:hypothetical protein
MDSRTAISVVVAVQAVLKSDDSEAFDENRRDDEDLEVGTAIRAQRSAKCLNPVCITDYIEDVIPRYNLHDFKTHFHVEKTAFDHKRPKFQQF